MSKVAVLGVGRVGAALARAAVAAGYQVSVASSKPADEIALITEIVIPGATAKSASDAVSDADVVIVAVPLHKHTSIDPSTLTGKVVVDAMNYWAPTDGALDSFEGDPRSSSEIVADHFVGSRVVKAFNHIGYHHMEEDATPAGTPARRALAIASDHCDAAVAVADLVDRIGFDAVHSGPLATGAAFEPGTAIFNGSFTAAELEDALNLDTARIAS